MPPCGALRKTHDCIPSAGSKQWGMVRMNGVSNGGAIGPPRSGGSSPFSNAGKSIRTMGEKMNSLFGAPGLSPRWYTFGAERVCTAILAPGCRASMLAGISTRMPNTFVSTIETDPRPSATGTGGGGWIGSSCISTAFAARPENVLLGLTNCRSSLRIHRDMAVTYVVNSLNETPSEP